MNSAANTHRITINAGTKNTRTFNVPVSRWEEFVAFAKQEALESGLLASITVTSARRGTIYSTLAGA